MAKRYVRAKHVKTKTARSIAAYTVDDYMNYLTDTKKIIKKAGAIPVSPDALSVCEANCNPAFLCPKCRKYIADY